MTPGFRIIRVCLKNFPVFLDDINETVTRLKRADLHVVCVKTNVPYFPFKKVFAIGFSNLNIIIICEDCAFYDVNIL